MKWILLMFLLLIPIASSVGYVSMSPKVEISTPATPINYTLVNTNNSIYWGGYSWHNMSLPLVNYVPYTGATSNVDLNYKNLTNIGSEFETTGYKTYHITRTISGTQSDITEIGNFQGNAGTHNFRISISALISGYSVSKTYVVSTLYNLDSGEWRILSPLSSSGSYIGARDFDLDIQVNNGQVNLRIRPTQVGETPTANVIIEDLTGAGYFTPTSATGVVTPPTAFSSSYIIVQSGGNLGLQTSNPKARFQLGEPSSTDIDLSNWMGTGNRVSTYIQTATNNGGSSPANPEPALILGRAGVGGQSYNNYVEFLISRYENSGTDARTELDIGLSHINSATVKVMKLFSNGNVIFNNTITTEYLNVSKDVYIKDNLKIEGNVSFKRPYGMFSSTETQTMVSANTPYPITFNWTEDAYQVYKSSDNANFSFGQTGDYLIELSPIFVTDLNNKHIIMWVQKNGVNIPRSSTKLEIPNAGTEQMMPVYFIIDMNMTDTFRVLMMSDDAGSQLLYSTNTTQYDPVVPSIIMTVSKVSEVTS